MIELKKIDKLQYESYPEHRTGVTTAHREHAIAVITVIAFFLDIKVKPNQHKAGHLIHYDTNTGIVSSLL